MKAATTVEIVTDITTEATIPERTIRTWPHPYPLGHQHPQRQGPRLRWHAVGCRVNGGTLPAHQCRRCREHALTKTVEALIGRLDKLAGGR